MHLRFGVPSHVIRRNGDDNKKERQTVKIASAF